MKSNRNMIKYGLKIENESVDSNSIISNDYVINHGDEVTCANYSSGAHHNRYTLCSGAKLIIDCKISPQAQFKYSAPEYGVKQADINIIDIYHEIIVEGDNCEVEVKVKGLALASKIIYRCKIKASANIKSLKASQSIRFLKFNNVLSEIDAIPILELDSKDISANHSLSISNIKTEDLYYLGLFGLDKESAEGLLIQAFMK